MKEYLTVREHAWKLSLVFEAVYIQQEDDTWLHIKDWLLMASAVVNTKIDIQYYDASTIFCDPVRDFEESKSKLWSLFCKELVTFNFIWGSLESLIEKITNAKESDSKPYYGIKFLRSEYAGTPIKKYSCVVRSLLKLMQNSNYPYDEQIYKHFSSKNTGSGLHLVSKIRNTFAHGSQPLPNPDDWLRNIHDQISIIEVSSRMILLTMQMLLIAYFRKKDLILEQLYMVAELYNFDSISLVSL
jgi:hypothetical protein